MKPVSTEWFVYSETGVPAWLVAVALLLALWVTQRWLRRECRGRDNAAARWLPATLAGVVLLAGLVLWRPVITRTATWEHRAEIVAVTDPSLSMQRPAGPNVVTVQLDLAAVWDAQAVSGRSLAARELSALLAAAGQRAAPLVVALERLNGEAAQGLPPGAEALRRVDEYRVLHGALRAGVAQAVTAVQPLIQGPAAVAAPDSRSVLGDVLATLEKALASLPDPVPPGDAVSAEQLVALVSPLQAVNRVLTSCLPLLDQLQASADGAFAAAHAERLDPVLAQAAQRTRAELAAQVATALPPGVQLFAPVGERLQTDLYAQLDQALTSRRGQVVSHCVLFSDGAHNGAPALELPARLPRDGIKLVVVGTGLSDAGVNDVVLLDWRLPRVLVSTREAMVEADVKARPGTPFAVGLTVGEEALATAEAVADADGLTTVALRFKVPAEGRQVLRLAVASPADAVPSNNALQLQADCLAREPRLLLVGRVPDWDTAWFSLATERQSLPLSQVFTADEAPKRGGLSRAIPGSLVQWGRYRAVLLHGPAFAGFSAQDADDLYRYVCEKGGTLLVFAGDPAGYGAALAGRFGWSLPPRRLEGALRLPTGATHLPCLRLGIDGPQNARLFAALGNPAEAVQVPPQDVVLVETERGEAVCSLGFYGRGKVVQWGLRGLHRMREYDHAAVVDRLVDGMVGELAAPLFPEGTDAALALYPPLPTAGRPCLAILPAAPSAAALRFDGQALASVRMAHSNATFTWVPTQPAATLSVGDAAVQVDVSDNPGMEALHAGFDEPFLRQLAAAAQGDYLPAVEAGRALAAIAPPTYTTKRATVWHPGSSAYLLTGLVLAAAFHWVLRKLAGLAM